MTVERVREIPDIAVMNTAARQTPEPGSTTESMDALLIAVGDHRDRAAFARLFQHFGPRVKAYLMRLGAQSDQAEEIMQEAMVMVWRRAETFRPEQASASTWIFTIARNKRIDSLRRTRRPELDPEDPALIPSAPEAADRMIETAQSADKIKAALSKLPEEQRELIYLSFYEEKPHSEIAADRGLPLGTVKSRLRLAMVRLRKELGDV